jgi:hypothetical protein
VLAYNSSYLGSQSNLSFAWSKQEILPKKTTENKRLGEDMAEVVKHLLSKCKVLNSKSILTRKDFRALGDRMNVF